MVRLRSEAQKWQRREPNHTAGIISTIIGAGRVHAWKSAEGDHPSDQSQSEETNGGIMEMQIFIDMDSLLDLIHDRYFDLAECEFDQARHEFRVGFSDSREGPYNEKFLIVTDVSDVAIHDEAQIQIYDLCEVHTGPSTVCLVSCVPLEIELTVGNNCSLCLWREADAALTGCEMRRPTGTMVGTRIFTDIKALRELIYYNRYFDLAEFKFDQARHEVQLSLSDRRKGPYNQKLVTITDVSDVAIHDKAHLQGYELSDVRTSPGLIRLLSNAALEIELAVGNESNFFFLEHPSKRASGR
jgi:hypothetical protein